MVPADSDSPEFKPFSDEQRRKLEEKVQKAVRAKQEQAATKEAAGEVGASATHLQSTEPVVDAADQTPQQVDHQDTPVQHHEDDKLAGAAGIAAARHRDGFHSIDTEGRANIEKLVAEKLKQKTRMEELRKHLLSMAGKQTKIDDSNPFNKLILQKGQAWNSFDVSLISGPEMTTQRSVARLWEQSPDYYKIVVGYALDAAGTWRSHTWLLAHGTVNEVTVKYAVYYGVPLSKSESVRFVEMARTAK